MGYCLYTCMFSKHIQVINILLNPIMYIIIDVHMFVIMYMDKLYQPSLLFNWLIQDNIFFKFLASKHLELTLIQMI